MPRSLVPGSAGEEGHLQPGSGGEESGFLIRICPPWRGCRAEPLCSLRAEAPGSFGKRASGQSDASGRGLGSSESGGSPRCEHLTPNGTSWQRWRGQLCGAGGPPQKRACVWCGPSGQQPAPPAQMSAQGRACQPEPVPPQVPADGGDQGAASLLLQKPLLSCVPHCYAQEVSRLCRLPAGTYRVVPSTYLPDTEGSFTVTIATRIDRWAWGRLPPPPCS